MTPLTLELKDRSSPETNSRKFNADNRKRTMPYQDFRHFLDVLKRERELIEINSRIDGSSHQALRRCIRIASGVRARSRYRELLLYLAAGRGRW
jgi:hypothetical protein